MKKFLSIILSLVLAFAFFGCDDDTPQGGDGPKEEVLTDSEFTLSQLSGTDALGRSFTAANQRKAGKYVGIYYFVWFGYHDKKIYDTSKLLEQYENGIVGNMENPLWVIDRSSPNYRADLSPNGAFHYWSEPLYGYYNSEDPWVARKHLELLSYADIDYLWLDYTNSFIYENATKMLIETILEMQKEDWKVPTIAFMLHTDSDDTLKRMYDEYLSVPEYADAFFVADEKMNPSGLPLVVGDCSLEVQAAYKDKIWYKQLQWPFEPHNPDAIPWIDWTNKQASHSGTMSVSIAQHLNGKWSSEPYLYPNDVFFRGRGWDTSDVLGLGADEQKVLEGTNFQYQWDNVFEKNDEINMVTVTGWNEWIAQKQFADWTNLPYHTERRAVFVDSFNMPFSRDAEMMKGGYCDNYYMQLVANIRKFKYGDCETGAANGKFKTVDITQGVSAWMDVPHTYLDTVGDTVKRDFISVDPSLKYYDDSARNDVVSLKFANDGQNLYLRVETAANVTQHEAGDKSWMNVYISTGESGGWENFNYLVNSSPADGVTSVEKFAGSTLAASGKASYFVSDRCIFYCIPLESIGVTAGDEIGIKVTDAIEPLQSIDNFYTKGECAPAGRFNYAYKIA